MDKALTVSPQVLAASTSTRTEAEVRLGRNGTRYHIERRGSVEYIRDYDDASIAERRAAIRNSIKKSLKITLEQIRARQSFGVHPSRIHSLFNDCMAKRKSLSQ